MINLKINDISVTAEDNTTILEVAKKLNIDIPTLCYLKGINENASCRMCVVEVKGAKGLVTSCTAKVTEGMEVYTNTDKIMKARKQNLELILANHNQGCDSCYKNNKCKLQELASEYNVKGSNHKTVGDIFKIDNTSSYLIRDPNKCILCNRCVAVCKDIQNIAVIGKNKRGINTLIGCAFDKNLKDVSCIACGQCVLVCPTGALVEKNEIKEVQEALDNKDLHVVVATAPSVRVALGEEFGLPIGTNVKGKMVAALKRLGFNKVFDVNFGADLTIMEEVHELIRRLKKKKDLPMFTSCSPGWIKYVEHYHPEMIKNLSSCKSPQQMIGAIVKTYYAKKNNIDPKKIFFVTIMPCIAKKFEKERKYQNASKYPDVDAVLTTRELAKLIKIKNIDFKSLENEEYDNPLGTGASVIFGNSGGVMEAALRTFVETLTKKPLDNIDFTEVRGLEGVKEATYIVNGKEVKVAVVSSIKNANIILNKIKNKEVNYHFIEFMTCPGGCINGGGQPLIDYTKHTVEEVKKLRSAAILEEDGNLPTRKAHESKDIIELYKIYLGKPGSRKAEKILHTKYEKREKYNKN
jgi:NADP-reducing hydrogenase subunit HndD